MQDLSTVLSGRSAPDFGSKEKNRSAKRFTGLSWDYLESISPSELKNIAKEAANLMNGFMSNGFIEHHNIRQSAMNRAKALHDSKSFVGARNKFKDLVSAMKAASKTQLKAIGRQLNHIDQHFGGLKNTAIYENIVAPISQAFARHSKEMKRIKSELQPLLRGAIRSRVGRFGTVVGS